jgi:hypothetical protein
MKAYLITTGAVFALLVIMHILRLATESTRFLMDPIFMLFTVGSAALAIWAWMLFRRLH